MYVNTKGIILRETAYKDSSKILTVLTGGEGKLTVAARGALRKNSGNAAQTQLLAFSDMTIYRRGDRWTLTESRSIEQFIGLRDDIGLLALGAYFAELAEAVSDEDSPNPQLLPLLLNALFALSEKAQPPIIVKPVFEIRLMAISGFSPRIEACHICGAAEPPAALLDYCAGTFRCENCERTGHARADFAGADNVRTTTTLPYPAETGNARTATALPHAAGAGNARLGPGALKAARFVIDCDLKKIFSFKLGGESLAELGRAAEGYLLTQLDRSFRTLDFYKGLSRAG